MADLDEALEAMARFANNPLTLTIDLHRGHLDSEHATLPLEPNAAAALLASAKTFVEASRQLNIPVVHVVTAYRDREEILSSPYWRFQHERPGSTRAAIAEHNLVGSRGLELMPEIWSAGDRLIATKKRYDCFVATDLEFILESGAHDSLFVSGVNTNSCVLATAVAASVRDYAVFVLDDSVDTMLGRELHSAALSVWSASFGWTLPTDVAIAALKGERK